MIIFHSMPWVVSQFINPCCSAEERQSKHRSPLERGWSLCWVLMEWNSDIQQTGFKACVADIKHSVNIPGGLYKPLPSASPIASVNHNPSGLALCCTASLTFIVGCISSSAGRKQCVHAACSAEQGRSLVEMGSGQPLALGWGGNGLCTRGCSDRTRENGFKVTIE